MSDLFFSEFRRTRLRRNRKSPWVRELMAQHSLSARDLILPLFVIEGDNKEEKIANLPGVSRFSIDLLLKKVQEAANLGIKAIMLFPVVDQTLKTQDGEEAWNANNLICRTIKEIKNIVPEIGVIADVALDPYSSHGQDGIMDEKGYVLNDATIELLCKQAIVQAEAGCDIIAPSDMMDGRVGSIRDALDESGFSDVGIMSYGAKYASHFYGPFRDAVGSAGNLKSDKKTYQMDFRNADEAMREIALDVEEGADSVIIKPGMPYLDIIANAAQNFELPMIAYQVSGEYAMLKFAAEKGVLNFDQAFYESLIAFKRAGARAIITYGAIEILKLLRDS